MDNECKYLKMDALEFVNELYRMCHIQCDNCLECPINGIGCTVTTLSDGDRKIVIEEVEKWSKAHPKKTRQSEFLELFPRARMLPNGVLVCRPCEVDYDIPTDDCGENCGDCRKEYWLQEVE